MKPAAWMLMLLVLMQMPVQAGNDDNKATCEKIKQKIRLIESKMRDGYSAAQGIRYDARLRELKDQRYKLCRK